MAEEKTAKSETRTKKKKAKHSGRIGRWFRELRSELKKVVWPTRKQIINNTLVSLAVMFIFAIIVWGFDQAAGQGIRALISLGG